MSLDELILPSCIVPTVFAFMDELRNLNVAQADVAENTNRDENKFQANLSAFIAPTVFEFMDKLRNSNVPQPDVGESTNLSEDKFQANFDVQHFKPDEISVKINEENGTVTIEGKHEEKQDEQGQISRHFVRKYTLPEDCDFKKLQSKLSSDGILSITAPKIIKQIQAEGERSVPIVRTGKPIVVSSESNIYL